MTNHVHAAVDRGAQVERAIRMDSDEGEHGRRSGRSFASSGVNRRQPVRPLPILHDAKRFAAGWLLLLAPALFAVAARGEDAPPQVDFRLEEKVDVRLVTIDVLVLDRDSNAVPGLAKADFELKVDGFPTPIDTLDESCDPGSIEEPRSKKFGDWSEGTDLPNATRRIVLAFDYLHLGSKRSDQTRPGSGFENNLVLTETLENLRSALAKKEARDEEIMLVALTGGIRVEQPFTRNRQEVLRSLERMEHDITLWNGNFAHLNELSLFRSLEALVTVLASPRFPGSKAVVLFTRGDGPGASYEPQFRSLSAIASQSRVGFYPVDARGLTTLQPFT